MKRLPVFIATQPAGELLQEADGECVFNYHTPLPEAFVSLTMPVRAKSYAHARLLPLFEMHLPEGYLLSVIKKHFGKLGIADDFALLSLLAPSLKGRVTLSEQAHADTAELALADVLHNTSPDLFEALVQRFALHSPLSGVQPKVLAPLLDRATLRVEDFVVKSWGPDYPHLALNEWLCMRCLQEAQIAVPEFYLSEDERFFVMRRFDRHPHGGYWGFEDFCVLQAKSRDEKYTGSYEQLAKEYDAVRESGASATGHDAVFQSPAAESMAAKRRRAFEEFRRALFEPGRCAPGTDLRRGLHHGLYSAGYAGVDLAWDEAFRVSGTDAALWYRGLWPDAETA
ncbi:MAG: type II toxin-antitoxin system HipA family toxin [Chromatiales bacterium]|nr:type II toxin-antitoxin system HipA family toxin [Chromatiales bacterium]